MRRTSYEIQWKRKSFHPQRPDFDTTPDACRFVTPDGESLFTVVTHGGPSEGIFALIAETPRLRDHQTMMADRIVETAVAVRDVICTAVGSIGPDDAAAVQAVIDAVNEAGL